MTKTKRRMESSEHLPAKRAKVKDDNKNEEDELNAITDRLFGTADIASAIFSFLESRPLLRFACLSKTFSTGLSYKHVILAGIMSGRNGSMTIENLLPPLQERSIWVPSPMRLLRLVCGKRCELCNQHRMHYIPPTFGMFLCQNRCMEKYTASLRKSKKWNPYRDHVRVTRGRRNGSSKARGLRHFIFSKPLKDKAGERIGPLLTIEDIVKLEEKRFDDTSAEETVDKWMSACDALQPDGDSMLKKIFQAVEESKEESAILLKARKEEKTDARNRRMENRRQQVDSLIAQLDDLLTSEVPWKPRLARRNWSLGRYFFEDPILDKVAGDALLAPGKLKKSKLQELVDKVQAVYDQRALMDQHLQTIVSQVDHERAQDALSRKWCKQWCHYQFDEYDVQRIIEAPLCKPRSLKPNDLAKLAKRVTLQMKNKEKSDELLEVLETKLQGVPRRSPFEMSSKFWVGEDARYKFLYDHVHATIGRDFAKPCEITDDRLEQLSQELQRRLTIVSTFKRGDPLPATVLKQFD